MKIVIIDYGSGNVESVKNALIKICDKEIVVSNKIFDIKSSTHLILPGVGAFADCINGLKAVDGLSLEIRNQLLSEKKPFLGICVGMQVLASFGYEDGEHSGLALINGKVKKINAVNGLKLPQMGWNEISIDSNHLNHRLLKDIEDGEHFYFANSYHFVCQNSNNILAKTQYGEVLTAVIAKDNICGVQFHPEKSGESGLRLLHNFLYRFN